MFVYLIIRQRSQRCLQPAVVNSLQDAVFRAVVRRMDGEHAIEQMPMILQPQSAVVGDVECLIKKDVPVLRTMPMLGAEKASMGDVEQCAARIAGVEVLGDPT